MTLLQSLLLFIVMYGFAWCLFVTAEAFWPAKKQSLVSRQSAIELGHGVTNYFIMQPLCGVLNTVFILYALEPYMPYHLFEGVTKSSFWLQLPAALLVRDFTQYVRHRFTHRFLWSVHATHHSAPELRATTHFRMHPVDYTVASLFDTSFLFVLGFSGDALAWATFITIINNMWLHVNVDLDYGPLRHVLVSPNYHKWHHANTVAAVDKNFADLFPVLDLLGGTYAYPRGKLPSRYGVLRVPKNDALYHSYWGELVYPVRQAVGLRKKMRPAAR